MARCLLIGGTMSPSPPAAPIHRPPRALRQHLHLAAGLARAALDRDRPLMAHVVVTRRCNLSCGYCTEYDKVSPPVPLGEMKRRIDHIARLGTVVITLTGGEALLHPELPAIVAHVRSRGMTAAVNTNGFLLDRDKIEALNAAGLFAMQVSVDNLRPTAVTRKSLRPLLPKLRVLAAHARFRVRINTVLGVGDPDEALEVARAVMGLGFDAKCTFVRHPDGTIAAVDDRTRDIYEQIKRLGARSALPLSEEFQDVLLRDGEIEWHCRAGARFFTVCEDGLVHLCTPRWGEGAKPLADYGLADIRHAFDAVKRCASRCPVAYAHQGSALDRYRAQDGRAVGGGAVVRPGSGRIHLAVVSAP